MHKMMSLEETMRAYIAGPLFNEGERWHDEQIEARVARVGIETFLPHRDTIEALSNELTVEGIFKVDIEALDQSTIVVANLNGFTTDDGTAWELGYAYARGKHLIGVYTDITRHRFERWTVNPMLEGSIHKLVRSLDELEAYLREYVGAES
jgi:nucleoside 2-deoxyribosyltransferase